MKNNKIIAIAILVIGLLAAFVTGQTLTFNFGNEQTNVSFYAEIDGQRILVPYQQFFNDSKKFGFKINETSVEQYLTSQGKIFNKKLYYKIDSSEEYFNNSFNPYILERNLTGKRLVKNQIGQLEERQLKRFIDFSDIFNKENNLFDYAQKEINQTMCHNTNCTNFTKIPLNITIRQSRDIGFSKYKQTNWTLEFYNLFDLDPSFVDDTDTNWNAGTFNNMAVQGTGGDANLTSSSTSGHYGSQIFDSNNNNANWSNFTITSEAQYGMDLEDLINASTVLYMKFDNATGESDTLFRDYSQYLNNGTCSGANCPVYTSNSKFGRYALSFDGTDDYVGITDSNSLDVTNMTLEAWIFRGSTGTRDMIITKTTTGNNGWQFEVDSSNVLSWSDSQSDCAGSLSLVGSTIISVNQWYHVTATRSSDDFRRIYVNGVLDGSVSDTNGVCVNAININIGARNNGGADSNPFHGTIDEAAIWNRGLSADEIRNIYLRGAYNVNVSIRVCDDSACSGESYIKILNKTNNSKIFLNNSLGMINRYFQYNITYSNSSAYGEKIVINNVSIEFINVSAGPDITPPTISSLINSTTTNQSVAMTWSTDENANETNTLGLCPSFTNVFTNSNNTLVTSHIQAIGSLANSTNYCFNTTACDSSNNCASANLSFITAANVPSLFADENQGVNAIGTGVQNALLSGYTNFTSQQVYGRSLTNQQFYGTFDWMAKKASKVWIFNYITSGESHVANTFNLTPSVYVLQIANLTQAQITLQVESLLNATK